MDIGILYVVFNKWIRNPETNEYPYKIGITRGSVEDRYYGLGLKMPGKFETLFAYKFDDCAKAEQLIHGILNKKRENGEWFNINQKELDIIKANCEVMDGIPVTDEVENEIKEETEAGLEIGIESEARTVISAKIATNEFMDGMSVADEIKNEIKEKNRLEIGIESETGTIKSTGITARDILDMKQGYSVTGFSGLIINSKIPNSVNWAGEEYKIRNTPMKGINWIGNDINPVAVIIRTTGKYTEDSNGKRYAFEAKNGVINDEIKKIKSNQVIINQKKNNYPILYFVKNGSKYTLIGKYSVDEIFDTYVTLKPFESNEEK
jgi:hypothetical protein